MVKHMSIQKTNPDVFVAFQARTQKTTTREKKTTPQLYPVAMARILFLSLFVTSGNVQGAPAGPNMSHFGPGIRRLDRGQTCHLFVVGGHTPS